jgi:hypothetical protein
MGAFKTTRLPIPVDVIKFLRVKLRGKHRLKVVESYGIE